MDKIMTFRKEILNWGFAVLFAAGTFGFYGMETAYDNLLFVVTVFASHGFISRAGEIQNKRIRISCLVFSVFLTASFVTGHQIRVEAKPYFSDLSVLDWAYLVPMGGLIYVCVLNLADWILQHSIAFQKPEKISKKFWAKAFLLNVCAWIPYFMMFYPGNISLDSFECVQQALGVIPYAHNHPIAFTVVVSVLIKFGMLFGDINFGIACFSFCQMLVLAGILSYVLYWMRKKGAPMWTVLVSGAFLMLNPIVATSSVSMLKDILFGGVFLLLLTLLYDAYETKGEILNTPSALIMLSGISVFMSLWRNGIVAGVCVLLLVLLISYRSVMKKLLLICLPVLCLIFTILGPVYGGMNLPGSHAAESMGIPLQQIGYTLEQNGDIDEDSQAFLDQILPEDRWIEVYRPNSSDSTKFDYLFDTEFLDNNTEEFLLTWLKLMPRNLKYYVKAWLMNTEGYFHIGTSEPPIWYGIIPADGVEEMGIYRTDLLQCLIRTDLPAGAVEAFDFHVYDLPVFNIIFSVAANVWAVLFCILIVVFCRENKQPEIMWFLMPLVLYWIVILFTTPVSFSFRYMFAFHLALPVVLTFMLRKDFAAKN